MPEALHKDLKRRVKKKKLSLRGRTRKEAEDAYIYGTLKKVEEAIRRKK